MKRFYILFAVCAAIIFSCNTKSPSALSSFLNREQLPAQIFTVDINKDTTLITQNGVRISIPKGSLESDSVELKLEIKEALTNTDIVLAGLTTQSGGKILSSGGMIYFNAAKSYTAKIKSGIKMMVPTNSYNSDMKVFQGEEKDGKIDWTLPEPLPKDGIQNIITEGENLFKANCVACHRVEKDFTGPALYGITERRTKKWLYDFTRNPLGEMPEPISIVREGLSDSSKSKVPLRDYYRECLFATFRPTIMTSFPDLTDKDLDNIYSYIKTESDKRPDLKEQFKRSCCDSCAEYRTKLDSFNRKRISLIQDNGAFFTLDQRFPPNTIVTSFTPPYTTVTPTDVYGTYYTVNIQTMGWHNIDVQLEGETPGCKLSELSVKMQGDYNTDMTACLMIPSVKVFVEGGKLDGDKGYGFDKTDGTIPLPQNVPCYVIAFAEYQNKLIFGKQLFVSGLKQTINMPLTETTKADMITQIKSLDLDGIETSIQKTKNADKISKVDDKIRELEKFKPKNCNCSLGEEDIMHTP